MTHAPSCDLHRGMCAAECRWASFHEWLAEPLLESDVNAQARYAERHAALISGEIPA